MKLSGKIIIPIAIISMVIIGLLVLQSVNAQTNLLAAKDAAELESYYSIFNALLEEHEEQMMSLATNYVNIPGVAQAFAEGNRDEVQRLLMPSFQALKENGVISAMPIFTPPATVFLLMHNPPAKIGDDVSKFRPLSVAVNTKQEPLSGIEPGVYGFPIRAAVPVIYQGNHIGLLDCTAFIGVEFLEHVKERIHGELAIYVPEEVAAIMTKTELGTDAPAGFLGYASTSEVRLPVEAIHYQTAVNTGEKVTTKVSSQGHNYTVLLAPLLDYAGNVAAVVEFAVPRDILLSEIAHSRNMALLYGFALTIVSLLVVWQIVLRIITIPVGHITEVANQISRGDLDVPVEVTSKDEIGELAAAVERMRASLKLAIKHLQKRRPAR